MDTTSLGFQKPKEEEYYDINIFNKNTQLANDLIEKNSSAIGQLTNIRGYSKIPIISTDILLKNTNGWCRGYNIPNAPIQNTWLFYRTVIMDDLFPWGYGFVRAYDYENKKEFVNFRGTSGWEGWKEIPTANNISNPNLLINGDFQVWQRGAAFDIINDGIVKYNADRWCTAGSAPKKIERVVNTAPIPANYALRMTLNGNGWNLIGQAIEEHTKYKGKRLTLSFWARASKSINFNYNIGDDSLTKVDSLTTEWKKVCVSGIPNFNVDNPVYKGVKMYTPIDILNDNAWIEISGIKLELGEIATTLSPRSYGEELFFCQRYYIAKAVSRLSQYGANDMYFIVPVPIRMRTSPTIGGFYIGTLLQGVSQTGFNVNVFDTTYNTSICFVAMKTSHGLTDCFLIVNGLDAEIY